MIIDFQKFKRQFLENEEKKMGKGITNTASSIGLPDGMSFEEMRKQVEEFNKLNKLVKLAKKTMSKEDQKKIGITQAKKRREISEQIKPFINKVFRLIAEYQDNLIVEFQSTVSTEKPQGQKWLTFKSDEGFTFCVNKYLDADEPEEKE